MPNSSGQVFFPSQIHSTIKNIYCNSPSYSHCVLFVVCLHLTARILRCTRRQKCQTNNTPPSHNITYIPFTAAWMRAGVPVLTHRLITHKTIHIQLTPVTFFYLNIHFMFFMIKSLQIQISKNGFQFRIPRFSADLWSTISKTPKFYSEILQFPKFWANFNMFRNWLDQSLQK